MKGWPEEASPHSRSSRPPFPPHGVSSAATPCFLRRGEKATTVPPSADAHKMMGDKKMAGDAHAPRASPAGASCRILCVSQSDTAILADCYKDAAPAIIPISADATSWWRTKGSSVSRSS